MNDPVAGIDYTFTSIFIFYFTGSLLLLLSNYLSKRYNLADIVTPFSEKKWFYNVDKFGWLLISSSILGYVLNIFIPTGSSWAYFQIVGPVILISGLILWIIGKAIILIVN